MSAKVKYINEVPHFDQIWDLISDDPHNNLYDNQIVNLLPSSVGLCVNKTVVYLKGSYMVADGSYLLINDTKTKVISICEKGVFKHTLGQKPLSYNFVENTFSHEDAYEITDTELFEAGILNLVDEIFDRADYSQEYLKILKDRGITLSKGDLVHIEVYDNYSVDHHDIYFRILVFDGQNLIYPKLMDNYASAPPKNCTFPEFSLEWFQPLNRSGGDTHGYRWFSEDMAVKYNAAPIFEEGLEDQFIKEITVGNTTMYVVGPEYIPNETFLVLMDTNYDYDNIQQLPEVIFTICKV